MGIESIPYLVFGFVVIGALVVYWYRENMDSPKYKIQRRLYKDGHETFIVFIRDTFSGIVFYRPYCQHGHVPMEYYSFVDAQTKIEQMAAAEVEHESFVHSVFK